MTSDSSPDLKLWLCLRFAEMPLELFTRTLSLEERKTPIVLLDRQRICRMNAAAKAINLQMGNNMDTAHTISSHVVSFDRDEDKETRTLAQLAQWAYQYTPNVAIDAPDSLLLDISGCLKLFKGLTELKTQISRGLAKRGFRAHMAVNTTPGAASFAAASGLADNPGYPVSEHIAEAGIACMQVDNAIVEGLQKMGVSNMRSLLSLPSSGLTRRFGKDFTRYLNRLTGKDTDARTFIDPSPVFDTHCHFLSDITNTQSLVFPMKRLLGDLVDFLTGRQLAVNHIKWNLHHRSHETRSIDVYLASPENNREQFLALTHLQLEKVNDVKEVDSLSLGTGRLFPVESEARDLFHGAGYRRKDGRLHREGHQARANQLLNMFRARLGAKTCYGISEANDHRPEKAWKLVHLHNPDYWQSDAIPNPRPTYLLRTPRYLGTHPVVQGPHGLIALDILRGPEKIDFGWWDELSGSTADAASPKIAPLTTTSISISSGTGTSLTGTSLTSSSVKISSVKRAAVTNNKEAARRKHLERDGASLDDGYEIPPGLLPQARTNSKQATNQTGTSGTRPAKANPAATTSPQHASTPELKHDDFAIPSSEERDYYIARGDGAIYWIFHTYNVDDSAIATSTPDESFSRDRVAVSGPMHAEDSNRHQHSRWFLHGIFA